MGDWRMLASWREKSGTGRKEGEELGDDGGGATRRCRKDGNAGASISGSGEGEAPSRERAERGGAAEARRRGRGAAVEAEGRRGAPVGS